MENNITENEQNIFVGNIENAYIEDEMKNSYIDYSMSVIIGRALPDVRDGLKPVHRRILYAMNDMSLNYNRPFRKSARIVGEVLGKYHPHGDTAVYDSMVRMAQNWSLRYTLVDGQGNFGSVDGDSAAAMRYTEARMKKVTSELLTDIDKNTVDFVENFDESLKEPVVLPAVLPNLLVNGASGIAVGMATNIPPHNLNEICNAIIAQIRNPKIEIPELMQLVKGPDFPTGAMIHGKIGIKNMYETGRGRIVLRGKAEIEDWKNRERIIVTEIPYQVNKKTLIERIAELVHNEVIEGISDIRDESDRKGMRIVIELKRGAMGEIVLNKLYKHTMLENTFGVIMLAIVNGQPEILNLKQMISKYIEHRTDVVIRRTKFELEKAENRAHILEGYKIALANLDEVIQTIKNSKNPDIAKEELIRKFEMTELQALAVLRMQLQRLTGLEIEKIESEYQEIQERIKELKAILNDINLVLDILVDDLKRLIEEYGDERKTEILDNYEEIGIEDLIPNEKMVITITHRGYIKRTPMSIYKAQNRGGKGLYGMDTNEEDFVEHMFVASTHNYILFFTDSGKVHWLKVYQIPEGSRRSKGKAIINLLDGKDEDSKVTAFIKVKEFDDERYIVMATKNGIVKKTLLSAYSRPRKGGINAITLREGDTLIKVLVTTGKDEIMLGTKNGQAIRFAEKKVRAVGRTSIGVTGIKLDSKNEDYVVGMVTVDSDGTILTVTENGYGKRTPFEEYRVTNRAGKGIINIKTTERNGKVVGILQVSDEDELLIITRNGIINRQKVSNISSIGRNTQGVRLISLKEDDKVIDIAKISVDKSDEDNTELDETRQSRALSDEDNLDDETRQSEVSSEFASDKSDENIVENEEQNKEE